jgi:hypothetical protein
LESFNKNKQRHVENSNLLKGLQKIKNLLPLQNRSDYNKQSSDIAFSFKDVEKCAMGMPKYVTWDMVIDFFLTKT